MINENANFERINCSSNLCQLSAVIRYTVISFLECLAYLLHHHVTLNFESTCKNIFKCHCNV